MSESLKIRAKAADYARTFLASKYKDEYDELYSAYCANRGLITRAKKEIIDERLVNPNE